MRLVISQPRVGGLSEWGLSVVELRQWAVMADDLAALALEYSRIGVEGLLPNAYKPGEKQCRFCKAKADCPALSGHGAKAITDDFDDLTAPAIAQAVEDLPKVSGDALGEKMAVVDLVELWCKAVRARTESELLSGRPVPGFKLVEGRKGARQWGDKAEAESLLKSMRLKTEDMYDLSLISPTTAEKLHKAGVIGPRQWPKVQIRVELPDRARRLYQDMEREMFLSIGDSEIEAFNAASRTIKCLQLANGAIYTDDAGNWSEVHDSKLRALESIVEEAAGTPVLVAYHFKSDIDRLRRAFPYARVLDSDPQTIRDWNKGKIRVLFAHPASAGHGLNLQDGGNILAFFGHWWSLEEYQQIIERIGPVRQLQAGHDRPVFIHHIIAADTVDELVMARRESKRSVQDLLLDAMKRRSK